MENLDIFDIRNMRKLNLQVTPMWPPDRRQVWDQEVKWSRGQVSKRSSDQKVKWPKGQVTKRSSNQEVKWSRIQVIKRSSD